MKKIIITIDGHSACGKSTLAKALATELNYGYIDTGAMYRAVTYYFLENRVNIQRTAEMEKALKRINITFKSTVGGNRTYLNGKDVEDVIRKMFVSKNVSHVAAISTVRKMVVKQQVEMGKLKGIVMEGRDIGTVVFPNAELKIFLTADENVRTKRRYDELVKKGQKVSLKSIKDNLLERDHIDSTRKDSPLKKAEEAVLIDNSNITPKEQLAMVYALSKERIKRLTAADKKRDIAKSKATPQKRTSQPASKNQRTEQKNTRQNQPAKKVATQKTKVNPQKKASQPASRNQKTDQQNTRQNQPAKKVATQKTKAAPQKRASQPASRNQRTEQKNTRQNQPAKKVVTQKTKTTSQKRTSQPASKNQKTDPKNTRQNQPAKKVATQKTKTTPQKRASQPTSRNQKTDQKNTRQNQPEEKSPERKTKPTPKRRAKQPANKVVQKKSALTPSAKNQSKKTAPKAKNIDQKTVQQTTTTDSSTQLKKKKVRNKKS